MKDDAERAREIDQRLDRLACRLISVEPVRISRHGAAHELTALRQLLAGMLDAAPIPGEE